MVQQENFDFENTPASKRNWAWNYAPATVGEPVVVVSIVTPFFDPGSVFAETVLSVQRQSLQCWEWIVVNDGSKDTASLGYLAKAAFDEPRLRVFHFPANRGLSAARNHGLAQTRGEYVCWLDADDLIEPTFLEKCVWRLQAKPSFAFTKGFTIGFGAIHYVWRNGFHDRELFLKKTASIRQA